MKPPSICLVFLFLLGAASAFGQTILRVNQTATGSTHNGQTWATAFTTLDAALAAAQPTASQMVEIWVASGTYKPSTHYDPNDLTSRATAFVLKSHLIIRGGFRGNEATKDDRSPYANPTVLSGDIGTPMVGAVTAANEFPSQPPSMADPGWDDNCYNVLVGNGVTDVTLEYLTITGGSANSAAVDEIDMDGFETFSGNPDTVGAKSAVKPVPGAVGGGLFFTEGSTWTVASYSLQMYNCTFTANRASGCGGAVGMFDASAFIGGCDFENNATTYGGGGAFWGLNQQSAFIQCTFNGNSSAEGGGAAKILGVPSTRGSEADVDGFNDALRTVAFGIYGVTEDQTQKNLGYLNTADTMYEKAKIIRKTEGGLIDKLLAPLPSNPFADDPKYTGIGGESKATITTGSIDAMDVAEGIYAAVGIADAIGDAVVAILDHFGKIDKSNPNYQNWVAFDTYFNKYFTPQGLLSLAAYATVSKVAPGVRPDLVGAKQISFTQYTQAGRSGFASCNFTGNSAQTEGGAIQLKYNNLLVEACRFDGNSAVSDGGAISSSVYNMPQLVSSVFANNTSQLGESAIMNSFNSLMMIANCTIINNRTGNLLSKALGAALGSDVRVTNSIFWNNANGTSQSGQDVEAATEDSLGAAAHKVYDSLGGAQVNWVGTIDIRNSIIQSLATIPLGTDVISPKLSGQNPSDSAIAAAIAGAFDADARGQLESTGAVNVGFGIRPKLRDPSYGNSNADPMLLSTPVGKPSIHSPANNGGLNQWINGPLISHATAQADIIDVAGNPRIQNSTVDIGAYEVNNTAPDTAPLASVALAGAGASGPAPTGIGAGAVPMISPAAAAGTTIYYVKPTASGDGTGSSWANATGNLQSAISHANAEVWVAAGTYKPTTGTDPTISFSMASGVKIFGGFVGGETLRSARNWQTNATILSGDIGTPNVASDNSKNLFKNSGIDGTAVLDGFTLQGAFSSDSDGGAIQNTNSNPLIENCVFQNNQARNGGAIFSSGTIAAGSILYNCQFRNNTAVASGGAVRYAHSFFGNNLIFSGNTAGSGGAISATGSTSTQYCTIQNGLFYGNSSTAAAGGAISGSALYLNVLNSTLDGNTAAVSSTSVSGGGAIFEDYATGTGAASLVIANSILYKNKATNSGTGGVDTVENQQIETANNVSLSHSLLQGVTNYLGADYDANFSGDPLFVAEGTDFHLQQASLGIDSGDTSNFYMSSVTTDLDGNSRVINSVIDLGPYEHTTVPGNPVRKIAETTGGSQSFTFTAAYTPVAGDTLRWYVDRGDGLGYLPVTNGPTDSGVYTSTLTVSTAPDGFSYRLQVVRNGETFNSPAVRFGATPDTIGKYFYVKPVATGDGTGSDWADATSDLQSAIGHTGAQVWVAEGTYHPTSGTDRTASFSMAPGVKIYGGFLGNETTLAARNWRSNPTRISGDIGTAGVATDNSQHLFVNTGIDSTAVLDGFYLEDAYGDGVDGGAILNVNSSPAIQNCVFENNHALDGGAICSSGTPPGSFGSTLTGCEFRENTADVAGGAVDYNSSWEGNNLLFTGNTATIGGAVHMVGDATGENCTLQNALFYVNQATAGLGGAISSTGLYLTVANTTFYNNLAKVNSAGQPAGGGIYSDFPVANVPTLMVYNSIFYKNVTSNTGSGGNPSTELQQIGQSAGNSYDIQNSLIQGLQIYAGGGGTNFDGDPLFVAEGSDFHVSNASLTIDAGNTNPISSFLSTTDLDGNNRVINGVIDLGPYEHAATGVSPLKTITATSSGLESYTYTASDYSAVSGDTLQWCVDRGDGNGFVALYAHDPFNDNLPVEYLGLNTASLTVLSPPSGFLFRLQLLRGTTLYYSPIVRMSPTEISRGSYIYVRPTATGDGSGSGWTNATSNLQAAMSHPNAQVWVQRGNYYPTSGTDRTISFSLGTAVKVYGGFKGNESLRNARDYVHNLTVISGDIGTGSAFDNSRHLFQNVGVGASSVLDGFTFQDAYADGEDGGAILNTNSSPTIQNCIFLDNYARNGGAICSMGTPPGTFGSSLLNCQFTGNTAQLQGGAISYNSSVSVANVSFNGNKADTGGAIYAAGTLAGESCTVQDGLFVNNQAQSGNGGAIYTAALYLNISNATFYGNQSTFSSTTPLGGAAVYQAYTLSDGATLDVYNSIFYGNGSINPGSGGLASLELQQVETAGGGWSLINDSLIQGLNQYATGGSVGNFDQSPAFVNAAAGDFHLSDQSPCIGAGTSSSGSGLTVTTDLDGHARVLGGSVDLGPYVYTGTASLGRVTSSSDFSSGSPRFFKTANFTPLAGDTLQWYIDRGDGHGLVPLSASSVYSGVNTTQLTITSPSALDNGAIFQLQVLRGGTTLITLSSALSLPLTKIYVDATRANQQADGASWATAYGDLTSAINASGPGSTIWVAAGTYYPTSGSNTNAAFTLPANVPIYGGFSNSATTLADQNPTLNPTILSGRLNNATSRLSYSRHVVLNQGALGRTALLDGFILQDAFSSLMVNDGASPTIRNCIFQNNDASGAIDGVGAAISNIDGANPLIAECQFLGNTCYLGGALYLSGASATVENSLFAHNNAGADGGVFYTKNGTLNLVQCTVVDNTTTGNAAALYADQSTVTVSNSIFWHNIASFTTSSSVYNQAISTSGGSLVFNNSCVDGGNSLLAPNVTVNPLFAPGQVANAYALAAYSPLINAGSISYAVSSGTDLVGNPRVFQNLPDMGAYELQTIAPISSAKITSLPKSFTAYDIGGSVDFTVTWPAGATLNPRWTVLAPSGLPLDPSRYSAILFSLSPGVESIRITNLSVADSGIQVSFTDAAQGLDYTPPAILTVKVPRTVYVNAAATGTNNGTSWANAYTALDTALDQSQPADEIWVAGGTYAPVSDAYFRLPPTVSIYGGFAGTETARTDRNFTNNPTILQGVGTNPVVYGALPDTQYGLSSVLDGFTVQNGTGPIVVYNSSASTTYQNCIFRGNAGYLGNFQSQVQYNNCEFAANAGQLFVIDGSTLALSKCSFHDNTAPGDLINSYDASVVTFSDDTVSNNTDAGAFYRNTEGSTGTASLTVLRSAFRGNTDGGGVIASEAGTTSIESSLFSGNNSSSDIATIQNSGTISIVASTIADNHGGYFGGGLGTYTNSTSSINSCIFWGNRGTRNNATIEAQQVGDGSGTVTVVGSIIEGLSVYAGSDNTSYYPVFVNEAAGDYHLQSFSPGIDKGEYPITLASATDLDGNPRPQPFTHVDDGAYESEVPFGGHYLTISSFPTSLETPESSGNGFTIVGPGGGIYAYQWQYFDGTNWVNVTPNSDVAVNTSFDTTTSTLYFNSAPLSLNGTHYRVVIVDAQSGINYTSPDLVLTVDRPRIIYVNGGVSASGDGTSWATAFKTVQEAIANTDYASEIWVQGGTYSMGTGNTPYLQWNIRLYGGFAGTETAREQRDWTANPVTLVGNGKQIFSSSQSNNAKPGHAVLDGFTLTGNTSPNFTVVLNDSDAVVSNCTFQGDSGGLGVTGHSNPVISNCVFDSLSGTAVSCEGDTETISGCTFRNNRNPAANAGGSLIYIFQGATTLTDSTFTGNTVSGGLIMMDAGADPTIFANVIAGTVDQLSMSRCQMIGNTAYAGVFATEALVNVDNSLFAKNTLTSSLFTGFLACQFNLTNVTAVDNTSTFEHVVFDGDFTRFNLKNSILWGNRSSWPYAALIDIGIRSLLEDAQMQFNDWTLVSHSTLEGASAIIYGGNPNGNSGYDPLFVDAASGNYQLSSVSPDIDQGDATAVPNGTLDLASQPRISGAQPDMGAYEFGGTPGTPIRVTSNLGAKKILAGLGTQYTVQPPAGATAQWQVNTGGGFVNVVPDANDSLSSDGSVLTLSNASLAMSGDQYRYVLSGGVSYTSGAAVLTVVPKPVVYVNLNATGGNRDGTSWANAYISLSDAMVAGSNLVTGGPCEVWMAQGTYPTQANTPVSAGTEIYGGFAGTETTRSARDVVAHPTILTIASSRSGYLLTDQPPNVSNTATSGIVVDGFTLTGPSYGIQVYFGPAVIRNCTFTNLTGTAVTEFSGPVTITDSTFSQLSGVGIEADSGSTTDVQRCTFQGGTSASCIRTSGYPNPITFSVEDSVFQGNTTTESGIPSTIANGSGATLTLTRCQLVGNHAAYTIENYGTLAVRDSLIANNSGGGVYASDTSSGTALTWDTVVGNAQVGVGLEQSSRSVSLTNSIVAGNGTQIFSDSYPNVVGISVTHSLIQNQTINGDSSNLPWNPLFTNAGAGDYTLTARSPAINAADPSAVLSGETDLAGNARAQSGAPDMGAYEAAGAPNPLDEGPLPTSQAVTRGVDGSFSITGSSSYTYTWQYFNGTTWVDITYNSTTGLWTGPAGVVLNITTVNGVSTLTIPSAPLNDSGIQFRAIIDGQGVTTDPVTLTVSEPQIMYVDASVAASGDGKTWATAYKDLDTALAQVIPSRRIIYLAKGTYHPANVSGYSITHRVEIYGGFPVGGGAFSARNPATNPVVLSGELGDPTSTADNANPVVTINAFNSPIAADTIIDGVTIDRGVIGISEMSNASPTLRNLIVSNSTSGGLSMSSAGGLVQSCQFVGNANGNPGGGADCVSSNVTFSGCSFRGNSAISGAGLSIYAGTVILENTVVSGNVSTNEGAGIEVQAGSQFLVNCTVVGNYSTYETAGGAGLYVLQGNLAVWNSILWANRSFHDASAGTPPTLEAQQLVNYPNGGAGFNVQASDIEGLSQYSGQGDLGADPLFLSGITAGAITTAGDFHLNAGSTLIDHGSDSLVGGLTVDADNAPRTIRTTDMGAYEYQGSAITLQPADLVFNTQGTNQYQVQITGSDAGYSYQWQTSSDGSTFTPVTDGAAYTGSQTATLQLLTALPAQNGNVFRVQITSPIGGVVTSRSALLTVYPSHYYVNAAAADDTGDGYTWATAFKTLGNAFSKLRIDPTNGVQIWVASGTYTTSATDPTVSFPLLSNVALYGGFTGTETALNQRDPVAHPTLLQGIAGTTAIFAGPGTSAITGARIDGLNLSTAGTGIAPGANVTLTVANSSFSGMTYGINANTDTVTVQNCQFTGNTLLGILSINGPLNVADSVFTGNNEGLAQNGANLNVVRSAFRGNGASNVDGAGVSAFTTVASLEDCLFSGNLGRNGGGFRGAGGIDIIRNCTFAGNTGEGIYFANFNGGGSLSVYNSILWGNDYPIGTSTNTLAFSSNDVQNLSSFYQSAGTGNISVDPGFAAPATTSGVATTAGDYRLTSSSPVVDHGSNTYLGSSTSDLAQAPRVFNTTVDLGAYEFQQVQLAVTTQPTDATGGVGRSATFTAASNDPNATYQWQVSTDGGNNWTDLVNSGTESGVNTATLTVSGGASFDGHLYRVHITTPQPGSVYSSAVTYHYASVVVSPPAGVREETLIGPSSTIGFNVAGGALSSSIVAGAFSVNAMQSGHLSLADGSLTGLTVNGATVSMQSSVPLKPGELVEVTTTQAVARADGYLSIPTVYQFRAGNAASGYGIFATANALVGAPATATSVACGDVNGDHSVDLVIGGSNGATVWLNNGTGAFTAGQTFSSGAVSQVLVGSLELGTNRLDVVLRKSNGDVEIWKNDGTGSFTNTSTISGVGATALGLADLNGDGALDLFIATAGADQVWFNNGSGFFADSGQRLGTGAGLSVAFGDFNNDNSLDVCTANGSGDIELWSNDGTGHFAGSTIAGTPSSRVITADLDRDDRVDLIAVSNIGRVKVYRQPFSYNSQYLGVNVPTISVGDQNALTVGDVDGDGLVDIVTPSSSGTAQIWKSQGYDGSLGNENFQNETEQAGFSMTRATELADLDGDGKMDVVTITSAGVPTIALYENAPAAPSGLTATAISDTRIALAWTDNATNENNYTVERSANGTSGWTVVTTLSANSISYTDTVPNAATTYYYRVRCNVAGTLQSAYSNVASTTSHGAVVAGADAIALLENSSAATLVSGAASVLANDSSPDAGTLQASVVTQPAHGVLALNADGTFTYTPTNGFAGTDSFTYRATNPTSGASATATVSITVTRLNSPPSSLTFTPATGVQYTGQSAGLTVGAVSGTDPDPQDSGLLTFSLVSGTGSTDNASFTLVGGTLKTATTITATAGLTRSIRVRVTDSLGLFLEETFTVSFTQAPTASAATFETNEDIPVNVLLPGVGGASALSYQIVSQPGSGSLALSTSSLGGNSYTYTPNTNFSGSDSFTYRVTDGTLTSAPATVTLTVDHVDYPPTLDAVAPVSAGENSPVSFTLVGHDIEGDAITYQLANTPTLGTVQINGAVVTYTPNRGVLGTETLAFTATAGGLTSSPLPVVVNITPEPVLSTVYRGLYELTDLPTAPTFGDWTGVLPANLSTPAHGMVTLQGSQLLYQHNGDSSTNDSFTYTLTDSDGDVRTVDVAITISDRVIDVVNANDSGAGSLRAALDTTNRFAASTLAPAHTVAPDWLVRIQSAAGPYATLTSATNQGAALGFYSFFTISGNVTVDATANPGFLLTTGGTHAARQFLVLAGANLTLKNLDLNNGEASDRTFVGAGAAPVPFGGAVLNFGTFTANNVVFRYDRAGEGAAIYNNGGTLSLTNCLFDQNFILQSSDPGGIVVSRNGTTTLVGDNFTANTGQGEGDFSVTGDGALASVNVSSTTFGAFHLGTINGGTLSVTGLPYALPDSVTRAVDQPVTIALATLLANDSGGPFASVTVDTVSAQGVPITRDGDNLTYAAPAGLTTPDTFTYTVATASGLTSTATVTVSIAHDPYPHGNADRATVYRGLYADLDVLANDSDDNGGTLTITAVSTPAHGTATIVNGKIHYVHDGGSSTSDSFTYSVSNGTNVTANVAVTLIIADLVLDASDGGDSGPGTLRAALNTINGFTGAGTPQWTIRIFAGSDQTWTPTGTANDNYPDFLSVYKIAGNVLIDATGSPNFTLAGPGYPYGRLFLVQSGGSLTLKGLTLANSQAYFDTNTQAVTQGGAVLNRGTFTATNVNFTNDTAIQGAALYNDGGTVTLTDCVFSGNNSPFDPNGRPGGVVFSNNGTLNLDGGVSIDGSGSAPALFVVNGTLNHTGTNQIASYQSEGSVNVVPGSPVAAGTTVGYFAGQPTVIALSSIYANDTNYAGATLTFDSSSTYGAPITRVGDYLVYNSTANVGDDSFNYTLTDSIGVTSTATITVLERDTAPLLTVTSRNGGGAVINLTGGQSYAGYQIQVSDDLVNWSAYVIAPGTPDNGFEPVTILGADVFGNATLEDPTPLAPGEHRFYRAQTTNTQPYTNSDPVGLGSVDCLSSSDTLTGMPFTRAPEFAGIVASVSGNTFTVLDSPGFTANQFVHVAGTQPKTYYVKIGHQPLVNPNEGRIYLVTANDAGTITVDPQGDDLSGITPGTPISVIPYWTLGTLFPNSDANVSYTPSTSGFAMQTEILIPDYASDGINLAPNTVYYYVSNGPNVGWRKVGDAATTDHRDDILNPDGYFIVRNNNGAPQTSLTMAGLVPTGTTAIPLSTQTSSAQDNFVLQPQPVDTTLSSLGLSPTDGSFVASASGFGMKDELMIFDNRTPVINRAPTSVYFYISNGPNVGWRKVGDDMTTDHGSDIIPAGAAIIIRKAQTGSGTSDFWTNPAAYQP